MKLGYSLAAAGGAVRAADWVETVTRVGERPFVPAPWFMPWYKWLLVDVVFVYGAVLCGVAVILRTLFSAAASIIGTMDSHAPPRSGAAGAASKVD